MGRSTGKALITKTVTITSGQTGSAEVDLDQYVLVGFETPAAMTGIAITFTVASAPSGTHKALKVSGGTSLSFTTAASGYYAVDAANFWGVRILKLVSGSSEAADRSLILHLMSR
jgi:hypothetical protein